MERDPSPSDREHAVAQSDAPDDTSAFIAVDFRTGRRDFIKTAAASGLVVSMSIPFARGAAAGAPAKGGLKPNAFVRVTPDDWVVIIVKHHEMGQGTTTGIATLVAEELDADWTRVRTVYAPSNPKLYNNLAWGPAQGTGGSSAMRAGFEQMRKAGATARALLVQAAAQAWGVPAGEIQTAKNVVSHASGKRASYGELALRAAKLPVPAEVPLKDPANFVLIGSERVGRVDTIAKSTGRALYTIDVKLPGLLTAVIARPTQLGARVASFDAKPALAVPGVKHVVQVSQGVAVVATGMWAALKGREALKVVWDTKAASTLSSEELFAEYRRLASKPGTAVVVNEATKGGLARAAKKLEAVYEFPYLAHATMEPMNCVAWLHEGKLETWSGHQAQTIDHMLAAKVAGLPMEKVELHSLVSGGSFGRRANGTADYVVEAVEVAKAIGGRVPVRVQRSREDDMTGGMYRPQFLHSVRVGLDAKGQISGWQHMIVGQSILAGGPFAAMMPKGIDPSSVEGVAPTPYAIANMSVDLHSPVTPVSPLWWRSVGHTHTAYVMETLMDELAAAAGQDPVAYRLALLQKQPRHAAVLKLAADKAGWGQPLPKGRARGVALHESFQSCVAMVADVSLGKDGIPHVERVVVAIDCGLAINPDIVRAQMEGSVGFALGAALYGEITVEKGAIVETNFDGYRTLRMEEMPVVEVHIMPSKAPPTGVGEPGVPPTAPAVANAFFKLTGRRVRRLPFSRGSGEHVAGAAPAKK